MLFQNDSLWRAALRRARSHYWPTLQRHSDAKRTLRDERS